MGINVLSLFDGISVGQLALKNIGIDVDNYFACEIKKIAIDVTMDNFPNTIQLGDVTKLDTSKLPKIDLLIGGSPCQDFSAANSIRAGLDGEKSSLFYEYFRILEEVKPKYFFLENVKMEDKWVTEISNFLGVRPINICASLVSPAYRNRLYWLNWGPVNTDLFGNKTVAIPQPKNRMIFLEDIIDSGYVDIPKARCLLVSDSRPLRSKDKMIKRYYRIGLTTLIFEDINDKENTCRYLNQNELERCMSLPNGYTNILNRNNAANVIGDSWNVAVVEYLFEYLKKELISE